MLYVSRLGSIARYASDVYVEANEKGDEAWNLIDKARVDLASVCSFMYGDLAEIKRAKLSLKLRELEQTYGIILLDKEDADFLESIGVKVNKNGVISESD